MTDTHRRTSFRLWRNKAFLVYFSMLSLLAVMMFGSFLWSHAQNKMVRGMLEEQRAKTAKQDREMELLGRLLRADGRVIVEGSYAEAMEAYEAILDSLPDEYQSAVEARMDRISAMLADRNNGQEDLDHRDLLIGQYRRTIADIEERSAQYQSRMARMTDSLESRLDVLSTEMARKEKALGKVDNMQVISFKGPKGQQIHYMGEVRGGKANGGGVGIWSTGSIYRGDWRNNLRHGQGTFEWADGERYEGTYVDGIREGNGVYYWPSGDRYDGQWSNDRRNGQGTLFDMDGNVRFKGEWKDDKPL